MPEAFEQDMPDDRASDSRASDSRANAVRLLKAMANEHRLNILCALRTGETSVSQLCDRLPLSQSAMSQHLAWLRNEHLVTCRREAQCMLYRLSDDRAAAVIELLSRLYGPVSDEIH